MGGRRLPWQLAAALLLAALSQPGAAVSPYWPPLSGRHNLDARRSLVLPLGAQPRRGGCGRGR